jgi:hypothetical protein
MVAVYLLFGLAVDRYGPRRGGQLRAFARLAPGASERRALAVSLALTAAAWAVLVALDTALRRG